MNQSRQSVECFTPRELAAELGVSYRRVLTAVKSHELRVIEYGPRTRLIHSEDAARWVKSLRR